MRVIAVLPAYNAAGTVQKTCAAIPQGSVAEIILVDDCSSDDTVQVAGTIPGVTVIRHPENRGYGGNQKTCYNTALEHGADVVIMIHPDFQYDPSRVPEMTAPLIAGKADMVMGSRFLHEDPRKSSMVWWRYFGNRFLTAVQNLVLGAKLSECHSGYRAYTADLLRTIPYNAFSNDFVFDSQMIAAVARKKLRIAEVSIPVRYLSDSSSISFRRSVRYGLTTLLTLLPGPR
jgi:glycosyltransferase involved in cell wall biosynthesis